MTFREYLAGRRKTDSIYGDFIADALGDRSLPDVQLWEELRSYLRTRRRGMDDDVLAAARTVWSRYEKFRSDASS